MELLYRSKSNTFHRVQEILFAPVICKIASATKPHISYLFFLSDRPSPPQELTVVAMTAESGDISWQVPEDDGGSPVTQYIVEKKDISRKSWSEAGKVPADTLEFTVPKLLEGQQYLFRVSAENKYGVSEPVTLGEPVTAKNPYSKYMYHVITLFGACAYSRKTTF